MDLVTPGIGLVFWTTLAFLVVLFVLKKFAWKPILTAIGEREKSIDQAISEAKLAREEIARMKVNNEEAQRKAREERDLIMKEAREAGEKIVAEAKSKAKQEAERLVASARETIRNEKMAAISELKNQVAALSIEIAEKIVRSELSTDEKQKALVNTMVQEINLN